MPGGSGRLGDVGSQLQPALPWHGDGNGRTAGHVPDGGGELLARMRLT